MGPDTNETFKQYYRGNYPKCRITDEKQPLLISQVRRQGVVQKVLYLIPEFTDEMISDKHMMTDLSKFSNIEPEERFRKLENLLTSLKSNKETIEESNKWGIVIDGAMNVKGYKLPEAKKKELKKELSRQKWVLIYGKNDREIAREFAQTFKFVANVDLPQLVELEYSNSGLYYTNAIEKKTLCDFKVITQCLLARNISDSKKARSVAVSINNQLIGKIGIDVGHNSDQRGHSVVGFVASLNNSYSKFYTSAILQGRPGKEIIDDLAKPMIGALEEYVRHNQNKLPELVIIYRDGVGDGMLNLVKKHEIAKIYDAFNQIPSIYGTKPKLLFCVVKKSTNVRFFMSDSHLNPDPGTVVDRDCTHPNWYDFYLNSLKPFKGTANPTHYHVIEDSGVKIQSDVFQLFTYHQCFLYFNYANPVRVPAPCQYAHKLAFLIGRNVHKQVS
eukprot:gene10827-13269_t